VGNRRAAVSTSQWTLYRKFALDGAGSSQFGKVDSAIGPQLRLKFGANVHAPADLRLFILIVRRDCHSELPTPTRIRTASEVQILLQLKNQQVKNEKGGFRAAFFRDCAVLC